MRAQTITPDDLWELSASPEYANQRLELHEGKLIVRLFEGLQHGWIANRIGWLLTEYVKAHRLGIVSGAETGYILAPNTVHAPDVGFISFARLPDGMTEHYAPQAPDLAVEVVSPNDRADEIHRKVLEYLRYGTRMVWLVYPASRTIEVYDGAAGRMLGVEDIIDAGDVLPGFTLVVAKVFEG